MAFLLAELAEGSGMGYSLHLFCACTSGDLHVLCLGGHLHWEKQANVIKYEDASQVTVFYLLPSNI